MNRSLLWAVVAAVCISAGATEWFVDRTRPDDSGNGQSVATAKRTIQAAVSAAAAGDVVTVLPGVYDEGVARSTPVRRRPPTACTSRGTSLYVRATVRPSRTLSARRIPTWCKMPRHGGWVRAPSAASRWLPASQT